MTIGKKITNLRLAKNLSQEQLAEVLEVSRQSISKWEIDKTAPQIDKLIKLCDYFSVSADELLREDINLPHNTETIHEKYLEVRAGKYFGTDGFRGEVNKDLTYKHAFRIGRFLGWYFQSPLSGCRKYKYRPRIVLGKDTRRSSYMLEYSLIAGLTASGADVYMIHVTTTPSISYITRQDEFDCGIMISASHNPFYDNGIKIVNRYGEKIDDKMVALIEAYIDGDMDAIGVKNGDLPDAKRESLGAIIEYSAGRNRYIGYLISVAANSYKSLRIGLDCANGSSWTIAKAVFDALGAHTYLIGASPDGLNINEGCGSTHIDTLKNYVHENHLDAGFAFDGDADRCVAVDENGNEVNGDHILYIFADRLKRKDNLDHNTVALTVMSNTGLLKALRAKGIDYEITSVGDRFVYECMQANGYCLGGEQSGHIILKKYATTGDGILTAIMITEEMLDRKKSLSALAAPVHILPQITKNVRVTDQTAAMSDEKLLSAAESINKEINGNGRLILRKSGTEPVIRIMAECETEALCVRYTEQLADLIKKRGYCSD